MPSRFRKRKGHLRTMFLGGVSAAVCAFAGGSTAAAATCVQGVVGEATVFQSSSAEQCYTVPAGVTTVHVSVTGAAGASGASGGGGTGAVGGVGATVVADVVLPSGDTTLYVEVGGTTGFNGGGAGGPGNGTGYNPGGSGGGASDVRTCPRADTTGSCALTGTTGDPRLIVAGGGGGGGGGVNGVSTPGTGGAAGYVGQSGTAHGDQGGGGGTSSGGSGSPGGIQGSGGSAQALTTGGGGGGGWWGGGAGTESSGVTDGGGGGSSFGPFGAVFGSAPSLSFPASVVITAYASSSSGPTGPSGTNGTNGITGTNGTNGQNGTNGKNGARGVAGEVELVTCRKSKRTEKCKTNLIPRPVKFTTDARAALSRGRVIYATGSMRRARFVLRDLRVVRPGTYTLTISHRQGRRRVAYREQIRIR